MTLLNRNKPLPADLVIPVYNERPEALAATISACSTQTYPVSKIFVIDDASANLVSLPSLPISSAEICLLRLSQNSGISAARNAGIAQSNATLLACVNTEVLPAPDWLQTCANYLSEHPRVGACYTRLIADRPNRVLSQWRMRFLETKFGEQSGAMPFAPGHAVLFRKEALDAVGGYDLRYRLHNEDFEICQRLKKVGWETHYVAQSRCISVQEDSFKQLSVKSLRESHWYSPESSLLHLYGHLTKMTFIRSGRNFVMLRWHLLPIDLAIWGHGLWRATISTLRSALSSDGHIAQGRPRA